MANCPNCGSDHIQLKPETNVSWGRAAAGYALFGVVGGAVGAATGEDRNVNACLDCGTSWKAQDLHKMIAIIERLTGIKLDLAYSEDRLFLNDFMIELSPYLGPVFKAEEEANLMIKNAGLEKTVGTAAGGGLGCFASILFGLNGLAAGISGGVIFFSVFAITLVGFGIGSYLDYRNRSTLSQRIKAIHQKAKKLRRQAELDLEYKVKDFIARHP